jgi:membrane protein YdbS with pleckstrin-like domain
MNTLIETIISVCELAEAEGRLLKQKVVETTSIIFMLLVGVGLLVAAIALALTAFHFLLTQWVSMTSAFFITSLICLLLAGGTLWAAMNLYNKK